MILPSLNSHVTTTGSDTAARFRPYGGELRGAYPEAMRRAGILLSGAALVLAGCFGSDEPEPPVTQAEDPPGGGLAITADCQGRGPGADWRDDAVSVGPFGLLGPGRYFRYARENRNGDFVVKLPAIVEGHALVVLRVPESERGRVALVYGGGANGGTPLREAPVDVTFEPCPDKARSGWPGGLLVDDDQDTVALEVQVAGSPSRTITVGPASRA
jgi:hypothetical protein